MTRLDLAAIRAWTRAQEACMNAYCEDRLIEDGLCGACGRNRVAPHNRRCWTCKRDNETTTRQRYRAKAKEKA